MKQTCKIDSREFFFYVIPSILSFALAGVYSIVDGFFVGNSIGDYGLSAINIAYPIVAAIQAVGTGIGTGGAVYYSIYRAEKREDEARRFAAGAIWGLLAASVLLTVLVSALNRPLLRLLGAEGTLLALGEEYIAVIALGTALQVLGVGLVPFIRNHGGAVYAMVAMAAGFITNIILDYVFVWLWHWGVGGAAWATVIAQGVTMLIALAYLLAKKQFTLALPLSRAAHTAAMILRLGVAPFGLALSPNISLVIINRFSVAYGGDAAVATYAVIAYVICIVYLIFQGVGDGSQPLLSRCYGERAFAKLKATRRMAYGFSMVLAAAGCVTLFVTRGSLGALFGTSAEVNAAVTAIFPIFLVSVPFVAIARITTASFYATEQSGLSYILTFIEPVLMLVLMLILPPLFGGQIMVWWSTVFARILTAVLALILKRWADRRVFSEERLREETPA